MRLELNHVLPLSYSFVSAHRSRKTVESENILVKNLHDLN